ncbi:MAG TPA: isoleucine--tRNA ligase [Nitrospinae bacterium]|nr:isoleucine--tRNA ligase [Nitrospinota bacterium]
MTADYKSLLNLPKTSFPMKGNLPVREPEMLASWEEAGLYEKLRASAADREKYILHDGPPYANGNIHMGTVLNKVLKDIIVKSKQMSGFNAVYVPGWDCHGLPIEHQVDKKLGDRRFEIDPVEKRRMCREYAEKFIDIQRGEFKRLGVFGDWENPYLTMSYDYEASTVRELARFMENGSVYLGLKPVHWAPGLRTALAEAEVEYEDVTTRSIYVRFPVADDQASEWEEKVPALKGLLKGRNPSILIWTTTPWTLPANLALAFHAGLEYGLYRHGDEILIFHEYFQPHLAQIEESETGGSKGFEKIASFKGGEIEGLKARHAWIDRDSLIVTADYVTLEQGTGVVHTAPGHGRDDYETGLQHGLEVYSPVDDDGKFTEEIEHFAGQFVFDADPHIIEFLRGSGGLFGVEDYEHPYPHDWRSHRPTIFRATPQWFISMDEGGLRQKSLDEIRKVRWIPPWGEERIYGMIENRPDWCISRQRSWGVPIVVFHCTACKHAVVDSKVVDHVADQMEERGADIWFEKEAAELLPPGFECPSCGENSFEKEMDILDVWFDSGVSQAAVIEKRSDLTWPADMYLEGSDQHRGWFHSSLLAAVGVRGAAPYREVLTHGYVVDGRGKKMSKSLGNAMSPDDVIKKYGAEILRLWVAGENYREDIRISQEILTRLAEAYRRVRNTCRFLLGNLHDYEDFDPGTDSVPLRERPEIDRLIVSRLDCLIERIKKAYADYDFHLVYHALNNFCAVDLSAFYLDVLKDRVYIALPGGRDRMAGMTTMHEILDVLLRLMAPILTFTAEEVYRHTPMAHGESIHLAAFPDTSAERRDPALEEKWEPLLRVRGEVLKALESTRQDQQGKGKGSSLNFQVRLFAGKGLFDKISPLADEMADVFIVSGASLAPEGEEPPSGAYRSEGVEGLAVEVSEAAGRKCAMSWKISEDVGSDPRFSDLSARCARIAAEKIS